MIKKRLLTCTLAIAVLLGSKLFIYSTPVESEAETKRLGNDKIVERHRQALEAEKKEEYYSSLNFANETIPVGIKSVDTRMKRNLNKLSYRNLQTHKLHRTAKQLFPKIVPILKKYGIPEDFKYMPLVESGLRSGTSHKGASGYWQFMPETARAFGLKVNAQVDERQDIVKSTEAAAKYLNALHDIFGSWTLTAAAYNMGEGGLLKSMKSQGKDNYYMLSLNAETSAYVYRLISMKEVIENPDMYGYLPASGKGMLAENISYQWGLDNRL